MLSIVVLIEKMKICILHQCKEKKEEKKHINKRGLILGLLIKIEKKY